MFLYPPHSHPGNLSLWATSYSGYSFNQYLLNMSECFTLLNLYATSDDSSPISWVCLICPTDLFISWRLSFCVLLLHDRTDNRPAVTRLLIVSTIWLSPNTSSFPWFPLFPADFIQQWLKICLGVPVTAALFLCELNYIFIQLNCIW